MSLKKTFELYFCMKIVVMKHLYGIFGKIEKIRVVCDKHGAVIVEDTA